MAGPAIPARPSSGRSKNALLHRARRQTFLCPSWISTGEIHSLAKRRSTAQKQKYIKARLADHPPEKLMDVATAQDRARQERQARLLKAQHARENPRRAERQETTRQQREALQQAQAAPAGKSRPETPAARRTPWRGTQGACRPAQCPQRRRRSGTRRQTAQGRYGFPRPRHGFNALTAIRHAREDRRTDRGTAPANRGPHQPSPPRNAELQASGQRPRQPRQARAPFA